MYGNVMSVIKWDDNKDDKQLVSKVVILVGERVVIYSNRFYYVWMIVISKRVKIEKNSLWLWEKEREGGPFSRSGPPSSLSGAGRSGFCQYCHSFRHHLCISQLSRQVHSGTAGALAATYDCECLLLSPGFAADTRNGKQSSPERPGRGPFSRSEPPSSLSPTVYLLILPNLSENRSWFERSPEIRQVWFQTKLWPLLRPEPVIWSLSGPSFDLNLHHVCLLYTSPSPRD